MLVRNTELPALIWMPSRNADRRSSEIETPSTPSRSPLRLMALVVVTHNPGLAQRMQKIYRLEAGRLVS